MIIFYSENDSLYLKITNTTRLSVINSRSLKQSLIKAISTEYTSIILDFTEISICDSSVLTLLVEINNWSKKSGKHFSLSNLSKDILDLIKLTKLEKKLPEILNAPNYVPT